MPKMQELSRMGAPCHVGKRGAAFTPLEPLYSIARTL